MSEIATLPLNLGLTEELKMRAEKEKFIVRERF